MLEQQPVDLVRRLDVGEVAHPWKHLQPRAGLGEIGAPTLVITGEDDLSTPPDHGNFIAEQVQRGTCLKLSPARHLANVERPDEVNRAVLDHMLAAEVR